MKPSRQTLSCIWLDYDRDGHLDLLVDNYFPEGSPLRGTWLLRNDGAGIFEDRTAAAGGLVVLNHSRPFDILAGLAAGDFNNDGWPDLSAQSTSRIDCF